MKAEGEGKEQPKEQKPDTFLSRLYYVFCGDDDLHPTINRSVAANTYQQMFEVVHIIILYMVFDATKNATYHIMQAIFGGVLILVCFIPRLLAKYYAFLATIILILSITIGSLIVCVVLIQNYITFTHYCDKLRAYSEENPLFTFEAQGICDKVIKFYRLEMGMAGTVAIIRLCYLFLAWQAYKVAHKDHQEIEKRKRRKRKFDENKKNKNTYSLSRKI